jgi:hypothetical protein
MGFFTTRERDSIAKDSIAKETIAKSADIRMQGKVRELVRPDLPPRRRPAERSLADQLGTMMQRVADSSVQPIDNLILDMQQRREELLSESARMQREIIEYARLNQSTMQSTKIISESLAYLHGVPDAPRMGDPQADDAPDHMPSDESRERATAAAQHGNDERHGNDDEAPEKEAEAAEVSASPTAEAT